MIDLKSKTFSGLKWSAFNIIGTSFFSFIVSLYINKILNPADFGAFSIVMIFIAISQTIVDSGFSSALIQRKNVDEKDYNSVFYLNIFIGVLMFLVFFFSSNFIAKFYNYKDLSILIKFLSFNFLINSFSLVHYAKLNRDLMFKTLTKINIISVIISCIVALILVYLGYGVWALAIQIIIKSVIASGYVWFINLWKPKLIFCFNSIKNLFSYGSKLMFSSIIDTIFANIYANIFGKIFSMKETGLYAQANKIELFPNLLISGIINSVFLPSLKSIQDENERLLIIYRKTIRLASFVSFPIALGIGAVSKPLILVLLNSKWVDAAPMLQILTFGGMLYSIHALNLNLLKIKGRTDLFLRLEIIKKVIFVAIILITYKFGIMAMIIGYVALSYIALFINTYYTGKLINYDTFAQLNDLKKSFFLAFTMSVICYLLTLLFDNNLLALIIPAIFGVIYYFGIAYLLKFEEIKNIKEIVLNR
jgi:teichuronic acid exporter